MFPCSLRYFANVPLFPKIPGRPSPFDASLQILCAIHLVGKKKPAMKLRGNAFVTRQGGKKKCAGGNKVDHSNLTIHHKNVPQAW